MPRRPPGSTRTDTLCPDTTLFRSTFLHGLLEWAADESFPVAASSPPELAELIAHRCQRHGWQAWSQALTDWLPAFLATPLPLPAGGTLSLDRKSTRLNSSH